VLVLAACPPCAKPRPDAIAGLADAGQLGVEAHVGADLNRAVAPYLARVADAGEHPHFSRWAADPGRHRPAPQTFGRILDWLLDGLQTLADAGGPASGSSG
jgi:hypothetical protein